MSSKLSLEIIRNQDTVRIVLNKNNNGIPCSYFENLSIRMDDIEAFCQDMIDYVNKHQSKKNPKIIEKLIKDGTTLSTMLLPPKIKESLIAEKTASNLLLKLDFTLVHIPWELLYLDGMFLMERFYIGRWIITSQHLAKINGRPFPNNALNMLIIANPEGNLQDANSEGLRLFRTIGQHPSIKASLMSSVNSRQLISRIKDYDIVHFAGHLDYHKDDIMKNGWKLSEGTFTANDIYKMAGEAPMPSLIFSNACQSVRTDEKQIQRHNSFGFANEFMLAGARHYIGTHWEISDASSRIYSLKFYKSLSEGQSVGESMAAAKTKLFNNNVHDACWPGYVLYGDPSVSYFGSGKSEGNYYHESKNHFIPQPAKVSSDFRSTAPSLTFKKYLSPKKLSIYFVSILFILFCGLIIYFMTDKITLSDKWTSTPLTLAIIFNAEKPLDHNKKNFITAAIQTELIKHPRIVVLELQEVDMLIKQYKLWESKYASKDYPLTPNLLPALLNVKIDLDSTDTDAKVIMSLLYTIDGKLLQIIVEELKLTYIFSQRKKMSERLIHIIEQLFPLRCRVIDIRDKRVILNIGNNLGVTINQQFNVIDKNVLLKTISVHASTCQAVPVSGQFSEIEKGDKAEFFNQTQ